MWSKYRLMIIQTVWGDHSNSATRLSYIIGKWYIHNIFIIFSEQILSGKLLLVVMGGQKSNLSCKIQIRTNDNLALMIYCEIILKML